MKKVFIILSLLVTFVFGAEVQIKNGWNLLGVSEAKNSSNFISYNNEVIYTYKNQIWTKCTATNPCNITAGSGFWYLNKSFQKSFTTNYSSTGQDWVNGWNLVSPTSKSWTIKDNFPTVTYAWRWSDGIWKLYDKAMTNGNYGFEALNTADIGQGIWVKSEHNGFLGNSPINIVDGKFESVTKASDTAQAQSELITNIKNNFDIVLSKSDTSTPTFVIGIKMTKISSGNYYYYVVDSGNSKVQIGKYNLSSYMGTSNISLPIEFINANSGIKLNFYKIIDYLMNSYGYSLSEMNDRFTAKENYKMEIYLSNIGIVGGEQTTTSTRFQLSNTKYQDFPAGSSKIEGILTIK